MALADVSETIGKHISGQLSDPEFPDLLPASLGVSDSLRLLLMPMSQ